MKRPNRRRELMVVGVIAIVTCGLLAWGYAVAEPKSGIGYQLFRAEYALAPSKGFYLERYRSRLWMSDGGYVSPATRQFLVKRLERGSPTEVAAIADFWVQQAQGREYGLADELSPAGRERLIASVMSQLSSYNAATQDQALFLVEEVRSKRDIGKGNFYVTNYAQFVRARQGLSQRQVVAQAYQAWWNLPLTWEQKRAIDPLKGKGLHADGL